MADEILNITANNDSGYYQSYIDLTNKRVELDKRINLQFSDSSFRKHLTSRHVDARLVKEISPYLVKTLIKPQKPIIISDNFYVANDIITNTMYICYKNLLMIDIDLYKQHNGNDISQMLPHCLCQIEQVINDWKDDEEIEERNIKWNTKKCICENCNSKCSKILRYRLFKSRNGYHAFIISHIFDKNGNLPIQLSIEANCDYFYTIYTYIRGSCVRLNRKPNEDAPIYTYIGDYVRGIKMNSSENRKLTLIYKELENEIDLHIRLCELFKTAEPCQSHNIN
jgi:hypothetical protein